MLQVSRQSQEARPELHGGRAESIGGLLRMPPLDACPACRADSHEDTEARDDRLGLGQIDLILVMDGYGGRAERRATPRAALGQGNLDGPIDLLKGRCGPMAG